MSNKKATDFKAAGLINIRLKGSGMCRWVTPKQFAEVWKAEGYEVLEETDALTVPDGDDDLSPEEIKEKFLAGGNVKVDQLKLLAEYEGIELTASKKEDIVAEIKAELN